MTTHNEQRLAELLTALPPAPRGWVEAAAELPKARSELDDLVERAKADADVRAAVLADLEAALRAAGHDADPARVAALRARLSTS